MRKKAIAVCLFLLTIFFGAAISSCKKTPPADQIIEENKNDYAIALFVGDTYLVNFEKNIESYSADDKVIVTVMGKSANIYAEKSGRTEVSFLCGNKNYIYEFEIGDTEKSLENKGLVILVKDSYQFAEGISSPLKIVTKAKYNGENVEAKMVYACSDMAVASVDVDGIITPISIGKAEIRVSAEYNGQTAEKKIAVTVYPNVDIVFDKKAVDLFLASDNSMKVSANVYKMPENALIDNAAIEWKCADEQIAKVAKDGTIQGKTFGKTNVIAEYKGYEAKISVNVYEEKIEVSDVSQFLQQKTGVYYSIIEDIAYDFTKDCNFSNGEQRSSIIDQLHATINGNGHSITLSYVDEELVYSVHEYRLNFIREVCEDGVVKNLKINYTATPQHNISYASFAFDKVEGVVENVVWNIYYNSFYVMPGKSIFYLAGAGSGMIKNSVVYISGTGWQAVLGKESSERQEKQYSLAMDGLQIENVLVVAELFCAMPQRSVNTAKINDKDEFTASSFNTVDFDDSEDGSWRFTEKGFPVFAGDFVGETIEVRDAQDILENAGRRVNYVLQSDVSFTLNQDGETNTKSVISVLYGTFDGNGHKVSVTVGGATKAGNQNLDYNFIGRIDDFATVKNTRFYFTINNSANVLNMTVLTALNNGTIKNVSLNADGNFYWVNASLYFFGSGRGETKNVVVKNASSWTDHINFSNVSNALFIGRSFGKVEKGGGNVTAVASETDVKNSSFDNTSFLSEEETIWKIDANGVPYIEAKISYENVSTADEMFAAVSAGKNIRLQSDLSFELVQDSTTNKAVISEFSGVFDGNGHTVTITYTGKATNGAHHYNFIGTLNAGGALKNIMICFEGSIGEANGAVTNLKGSSFVCKTNNGTIEDLSLEINVKYTNMWENASWRFISDGGNGTANRVVIKNNIGATSAAILGCEASNVLLVGKLSDKIGANAEKNIYSAANESEVRGTAFNAKPFTQTGLWEVDENGVPYLSSGESE